MSTSDKRQRDAQLVAEALRYGLPGGERDTYPVLMRTFTSTARSVLGGSDLCEPEELVNELAFKFLKRDRAHTACWGTVPTDEAAGRIRSYLRSIARNTVAELAEKRKRASETPLVEQPEPPGRSEPVEDRIILGAVCALRELFEDPAHREGYVKQIQAGHGAASWTRLEELLATRADALGPYLAEIGWTVVPRTRAELEADEARRDAATGRDTPAKTIASRVRRQLSRAREHIETWIDTWEKAELRGVSPLDEAGRARVHAAAAAYREAALLLRERSKSAKKTGDSQ